MLGAGYNAMQCVPRCVYGVGLHGSQPFLQTSQHMHCWRLHRDAAWAYVAFITQTVLAVHAGCQGCVSGTVAAAQSIRNTKVDT